MPDTTKQQNELQDDAQQAKRLPVINFRKNPLRLILGIFAIVLVLTAGSYGFLYAATPAHIKNPAYEHYHFRTQILVNGQAVDFAQDKFQEESNSTSCSAEVGSIPIDFHDKMDQMTHVHWNGMTGGEFLKSFGWNFVGGSDNLIGFRFDSAIPQGVEIFGDVLPNIPDHASFYIYSGDADNYEQKDWNSFLKQDLEEFFGKKSKLGQANQPRLNVLNWLIPEVQAHGGVIDEHPSDKSEAELEQINNLVGNVVIFVQDAPPAAEQVQARFDSLVPLHESSCGG